MADATATVPKPPTQHRSQTRYPMPVVMLARRMYGDGDSWTPGQIRDYIAKTENLPLLHVKTVKRWVVPGFDADHKRWKEISKRRRRERERNGPSGDERHVALCARERDELLLKLRGLDLTYTAISIVLAEYHGIEAHADWVRYRLRKLGAPKNELKARAARVAAERRRAARADAMSALPVVTQDA